MQRRQPQVKRKNNGKGSRALMNARRMRRISGPSLLLSVLLVFCVALLFPNLKNGVRADVLYVTVPFHGHANVLEAWRHGRALHRQRRQPSQAQKEEQSQRQEPSLRGWPAEEEEKKKKEEEQGEGRLLFLSWKGQPLPVQSFDHPYTVLAADTPLTASDPVQFTASRAVETLPLLASYLAAHRTEIDRIVYDIFCPEAAIVAERYRIPSVCSIPAIPHTAATFPAANAALQTALDNLASTNSFVRRYRKRFLPISDGFFIPGDAQVVWTSAAFLQGDHPGIHEPYHYVEGLQHRLLLAPFLPHRRETGVTIVPRMRPRIDAPNAAIAGGAAGARSLSAPVVYISFGSVLTDYILQQQPALAGRLRALYIALCEVILKDARQAGGTAYRIVIAARGFDAVLAENFPFRVDSPSSRVSIEGYVAQKEILSHPDTALFITHGGGNSVSEAIAARCPLFVLPFFGDQHVAADLVAQRRIGKRGDVGTSPSTSGLGELLRDPSALDAVRSALRRFLRPAHLLACRERLALFARLDRLTERRAGAASTLSLDAMPHLKWVEGDLLLGNSADRQAFVARLDAPLFATTIDRPFSAMVQTFGRFPGKLPRVLEVYNYALHRPGVLAAELAKGEAIRLRRRGAKTPLYFRILREMAKALGKDARTRAPTSDTEKSTFYARVCSKELIVYANIMHTIALPHRIVPTFHFVLDSFRQAQHPVTAAELAATQAFWHVLRFRQMFTFYRYVKAQDRWRTVHAPFLRLGASFTHDTSHLPKLVQTHAEREE